MARDFKTPLTVNGVSVPTVSSSDTLSNKTLTTPTIDGLGFANANHTHTGSTSGGQLSITGATTGTLTVSRGGTGATSLTGILKGNGTTAVTAVTAPSGTIVGTTDTQTLTNKTISGSSNTLTDIPGSALSTSAILLGTGTTTSSVNHTTTETTVVTVTATVPSGGRSLELCFSIPQMQSSVSGDRTQVRLKEGATVLQKWYLAAFPHGTSPNLNWTIAAPSAGSHTYTLTSLRDVGSGTITWYASAADNATIKATAKLV